MSPVSSDNESITVRAASAASGPWPRPSATATVTPSGSSAIVYASPLMVSPGAGRASAPTSSRRTGGVRHRRVELGGEAREHHRAPFGAGVRRAVAGEALYRAQARAEGAGGAVAVDEALLERRDAGAVVGGDHLQHGSGQVGRGLEVHVAPPGVLVRVAGQL
ncbi:hypothetical protein TR74_05485 [Carbonactinospora thermoautotrophica]|uniref:Uncharacterized protein n=1 Tax=Carbonactinospora thermoautotrophica TaxID=1469144 RepID=A0A132NJ23_9ACTN|nr:hypothetical protein TR74_05485 [Carbonactinospora thermoautotrophica]